ncbi:cadherin-like domain-containing protein, partial [Ramlibacter sp. AW1]
DTPTFRLTGADAALFAISTTGELSFLAAPDFENPADADGDNVYEVTVVAEDGQGGSDQQALSVTVTDAAENRAPVITSLAGAETANVSVAENTQAVTSVTVDDPDGDTPTFRLTGADAALFAISTTGELSFLAEPDFENPADADGDNVYEVTVVAEDGQGGSDQQALSVTVTDAAENAAPAAMADSYIVQVDATAVIDAALGVLANDSDSDGDSLSAVLVAGPEFGNLTLNSDGSFTYVPRAGYVGADSFQYKPSDGQLEGAPVTVSITVARASNTGPLSILTTGTDVIVGGDEDSEIRATTLTLTTGDRLDAGGGQDALLLYGAGTFNLGALESFSGVEQVRLINEAGGAS